MASLPGSGTLGSGGMFSSRHWNSAGIKTFMPRVDSWRRCASGRVFQTGHHAVSESGGPRATGKGSAEASCWSSVTAAMAAPSGFVSAMPCPARTSNSCCISQRSIALAIATTASSKATNTGRGDQTMLLKRRTGKKPMVPYETNNVAHQR